MRRHRLPSARPARRAGFTLTEVLIGLTILGVIGAALVRLIVFQTRIFEEQQAHRSARSVSRGAMNILLSDLRMVQDTGGLDSMSSDGKRIVLRVPYRFGLLCDTTAANATASFLPIDSAVGATASFAGVAWRNSAGRYIYVPASTAAQMPTAGTTTRCTNSPVNISTVTMNGRSGEVLKVAPLLFTGASISTPVFLWQWIVYSFGSSTSVPGSIGLFRTVRGWDAAAAVTEEIMAPFDTSARFSPFVGASATSTTTIPSDLSTVRGLELVLTGTTDKQPRNRTSPVQSKVTTAVFFENTR